MLNGAPGSSPSGTARKCRSPAAAAGAAVAFHACDHRVDLGQIDLVAADIEHDQNRPAGTSLPGRDRLVRVAGIELEPAAELTSGYPADIVGMLEGSTRSREANVDGAEMRDVAEAGLNEAAVGRELYGR